MNDKVRAQLAPTGVLRAGINLSNFLLVTGRSETNDPTGVAPDMAGEIAAALDRLREEGRLGRDRDGRYHLTTSTPGVTGIVGELYHDPNKGT